MKRLREKGVDAPILMLTSRGELDDKIAGFHAGADDYLTKSFALAELEVRLKALLLRNHERARVLDAADSRFDLATQEVRRAGRPVHVYARKGVDGPFDEKLIHKVPKVGYRIAAVDAQ